ncbi:MFS general substrate transporter [Pseudovirgaria hyperparasitica]|uniref:MFS general substrate transporter n=1 Tax=Pseudovirgaria hyperparasitica TaxID=470096 RepID=A0A6A6VUF6_9PEZI|nr:MFS general substrate transporter [Pseudovirgaria hyperparasitica]KAF2753529.1 MFS general substrate transporter [Pseudovirgaria hyperparasitica]
MEHEKRAGEISQPSTSCTEAPYSKEAASPPKTVSRHSDEKLEPTINPLNWSLIKRWSLVVSIALSNCIASMAFTAFEPAMPVVMTEFHSQSSAVESLVVSIYMMGYIVGPLLVAPVSELYGRAIVLRVGLPLLLVSLASSSASTCIAMFVVFRAIGGFGQIALLLMANVFVADLISVEQRGLGMSVILMGPGMRFHMNAVTFANVGTGPITSDYIAEHVEWRWMFWICLMAAGTFGALIIVLYRESCGTIVKAKWLAEKHMPYEKINIIRPSPAKKKAELRTVFQDAYGFTASQSGLAYLGIAVGLVFSEVTAGYFSGRFVRVMMSKNGRESKPEHRLPLLLVGGAVLPAGFLIYGWTVEYRTYFILPIIGSALIAMGVMYNYMPSQMYLVDCFAVHPVSATGAASVVRSIVSAVLPLAANPILLAFIALLNVPTAVILLRYGEMTRTRFEVKL